MTPLDLFYLKLPEPLRSYLLALRAFILNHDEGISEKYKYKLAFFYYQNQPFCYLWKDKISAQPYIGFSRGYLSDHPLLIAEHRSRIKILPFDMSTDIDYHTLDEVLSHMKLHQ